MFTTDMILGTLAPEGDLLAIGTGAVLVAVVFLALALAMVLGVAHEMRASAQPDDARVRCHHLPALRLALRRLAA